MTDDGGLVRVDTSGASLEGSLLIPRTARGARDGGMGTLLLDLLTPEEEAVDLRMRHLDVRCQTPTAP